MRLKYKFVVREVGGRPVAVAVGADNAEFNGMVKLNKTGELIFKMLQNGIDFENLVKALCEKYDISKETAEKDVSAYIGQLKNAGLIEE